MPAWEILPQEAKPGEVILSKRNEPGLLLATGNLILRPDHHQEPDPPAAWRYFEILTRTRSDLQAGR